MEEVGAVDGARNRYFMSSGGSWCPSTVTMVGFLASGGLRWPATAGTRLAPGVNLCQARVEALAS
tara:strand:+ start:134 stop:328 length:195 start_codon:yes stop_codon:yes gene_type:complete